MNGIPQNHRKISLRLNRKGALIEETYAAFQSWNLGKSFTANLASLRESNIFGARNQGWLKEILATLSSRFNGQSGITPLISLAKGNIPLEQWKPCLLWHLAATDELYYRFALEWLYPAFQNDAYQIRTDDVVPFVTELTSGHIASGGCLSEYGTLRAARDLLKMAADFGLITGSAARRFTTHHLPLESCLYILHALAEQEPNPRNIIDALEWRLFLMTPEQVERELMELHQFQRVHFEMAGSLAQLQLPCRSLQEYAERLANHE